MIVAVQVDEVQAAARKKPAMKHSTNAHDEQKGATDPGTSWLCPHVPRCPAADAADREAAQILFAHPEQGWSLLCNDVIVFDDTGELLSDGSPIAPHRANTRPQPVG